MKMRKLIEKITIKHYRAFKENTPLVLDLADTQKVNYLVGPNNSGKSLITRLFSIFNFSLVGKSEDSFIIDHFNDYDFFQLNTNEPVEFTFEICKETFVDNQDANYYKLSKFDRIILCIEVIKCYEKVSLCISLCDGHEKSHEYFIHNGRLECRYNQAFAVDLSFTKEEVRNLSYVLFEEVKDKIMVFDAIRAFDRDNKSNFFISGSNLVKWLAEKKNPGLIKLVKERVSNWLENEFNLEAPIGVDADIHEGKLRFTFSGHLELTSKEVGTGYTMLYILLMEIARNNKKLIVIDEIESHLQPGLVRVLMKIIKNFGYSQFIISTHSPAVLETVQEGDFLYRFKKINGKCNFEGFFRSQTSTNHSDARILREVCNELGVLPGDALLSNCVVWVEGPSEVFWLRSWLRAYYAAFKKERELKDNLIEGMHYSILMTGGSSIAHFGFSESSVEINDLEEDDFINVLRVNPNPFVILDSDNTSHQSKKFKRILRIAKELNDQNAIHPLFTHVKLNESNPNFNLLPNLWLLTGRELESYAHPELLKQFFKKRSKHGNSLMKGVDECNNWDVFSKNDGPGKILAGRGITNVAKDSGTLIHKDELARFIFNNLKPQHFDVQPSDMDIPNAEMIEDLKANLTKLLDYITKVNDVR